MADDLCSCGCGMTRSQAISDIARTSQLNEDQAADLLNRADALRKKEL